MKKKNQGEDLENDERGGQPASKMTPVTVALRVVPQASQDGRVMNAVEEMEWAVKNITTST